MSNSVVTRAVAALEAHVGEKLLTRTTRRVTLTQAGETYLMRAVKLVNELENLNREYSLNNSEQSGPVRICASPSIGDFFITPILNDLRRQFPLVEFTIEYSDRFVDPRKSDYDIEIRFGQGDHDYYESEEILPTREVLVASPRYVEAHKPMNSFSDIDSNDFISFMSSRGNDPSPIYFCNADGTRIAKVISGFMKVNDMNAFKALLRGGSGISLAMDVLIQDELISGSLVEVRVSDKLTYSPFGSSSIYFSIPRAKPKSKTTDAIFSYLKSFAFNI